ncbi:adenylate kinase-domain-containing protein [Lipomyces oligophaga]|uniref:adenylate kinase-domain-containing protein n=1 Tax=Lipomyces oligophaga TaxID=45792 RepID=UPI0034CEDF2D
MSLSLVRPARILLLGPPGSGKGTQTARLLDRFGMPAISSGDLLRKHIADKTAIGTQATDIMKAGGLLPDSIMTNIIYTELRARSWLSSAFSFLLDGFPRTLPQAQLLDSNILIPHHATLNFVVKLDVPHEIILDRIANRLVHVPSGRVYNLTYNPPKVPGKDDVTGEPLTRRPDDNPAVFRKRLVEYDSHTEPILEYYSSRTDSNKQSIVWTVAGESSDIIFPQLEQEIIRRFGVSEALVSAASA